MSHPLDKDGDFLARWLENDGQMSDEFDNESQVVMSDLKKIVTHADKLFPPQVNEDMLMARIQEEINVSTQINKSKRSMLFMLLGLILVSVIVFFCFVDKGVKVSSSTKQKIKHTLPDNSTIDLNANSVVSYEADYMNERNVHLNGEAFFNVQKGSAFKVITSQGSVEVLGTSFNVSSGEDKLIVSCKTGKVRVNINDDKFVLTPGKEVIYFRDSTQRKDNVNLDYIGDWQKDSRAFDKAAMWTVIYSLEQWYGIEVEIDEQYLYEEYTGSFAQDDLDKALKMVFLPMGMKYKKTEGLVIITK